MVAAFLAFALAVPAAPAAAAPEPRWRVHVAASGTYAVDYGAERDLVDGQGGGSWEWELKAVASGAALDSDVTAFRMSSEESSTIVLPDGGPFCRPPASSHVDWVRDERVGVYFDARRHGFQVDHPFGALLQGCHAGAHGMTLYDGAGPSITRPPPAASPPRRDRHFEDTWTQTVALDRTHDPGQDTHTFTATGTITVEIRRV